MLYLDAIKEINQSLSNVQLLSGNAPEKLRFIAKKILLSNDEVREALQSVHCHAELVWGGGPRVPTLLLSMYLDPDCSTSVIPFSTWNCKVQILILRGIRRRNEDHSLSVHKVVNELDVDQKRLKTMTLADLVFYGHEQIKEKLRPTLEAIRTITDAMDDFGDLAVASIVESAQYLERNSRITCNKNPDMERSLLNKELVKSIHQFEAMLEEKH